MVNEKRAMRANVYLSDVAPVTNVGRKIIIFLNGIYAKNPHKSN